MRKRTPFELNYNLFDIGYLKFLDIGLYLRVKPKTWLQWRWGTPEADVIWYLIGPFAFYRIGS